MAISILSSATDYQTSVNDLDSWSYTSSSSGSNRLLVLVMNTEDTGSDSIASLTYAGSSMTLAISQDNNEPDLKSKVFYLYNPTTGANDFVYTTTGGIINDVQAAAYTLGDATQSGQPDATAGTSGVTGKPTDTITTVAANTFIFAAFTSEQSDATKVSLDSPLTETIKTDFGADTGVSGYRSVASADTYTVAATDTDNDEKWGVAIASFDEDTGGAAPGIRAIRSLVGHGQGTRD